MTGIFSAAAQKSPLLYVRNAETLDYELLEDGADAFVGSIVLEKTSNNGTTWTLVATFTDEASGSIVVTEEKGITFRLRCVTYSGNPIGYTFSASGDDVVRYAKIVNGKIETKDGKVLVKFLEDGVSFPEGISGGGAGDVAGPGTVTAHTVSCFADTSGQLLEASTVTKSVLENLVLDSITGFVAAPADGTIVLDEKAAFPYTINTLVTKLTSGTVSIAIKINGTNVTNISAHSATSSQVTSTGTAANAVAAGDRVTMVFSSSSTPLELSFTLKRTRT